MVDYYAPTALSFDLFYFFPVILAALFCEDSDAYLLAFATGIAWALANLCSEAQFGAWVCCWNILLRFAMFFLVAVFHRYLRKQMENLKTARTKLHDALDRERTNARLDPLTQALNPLGFREKLSDEQSRSQRFGHGLSLLYLDLDRFKELNDNYGHQFGDEILKKVVATIKGVIRQIDSIGRLGGDEFVVLLPETNESGAKVCSQKIAGALKKNISVSASIGVAFFTGKQLSDDTMIGVVDRAMYEVKKAGKAGLNSPVAGA